MKHIGPGSPNTYADDRSTIRVSAQEQRLFKQQKNNQLPKNCQVGEGKATFEAVENVRYIVWSHLVK
jgi:hypothetical protein